MSEKEAETQNCRLKVTEKRRHVNGVKGGRLRHLRSTLAFKIAGDLVRHAPDDGLTGRRACKPRHKSLPQREHALVAGDGFEAVHETCVLRAGLVCCLPAAQGSPARDETCQRRNELHRTISHQLKQTPPYTRRRPGPRPPWQVGRP